MANIAPNNHRSCNDVPPKYAVLEGTCDEDSSPAAAAGGGGEMVGTSHVPNVAFACT